jgi:hypothetical protein
MRRLSSLIVVVLLAITGLSGIGGTRQARAAAAPAAMAVVALVDTGVNPYNVAFRDRSALAYRHPSTYIAGYPADAVALKLTLDVPYAEAVKRDAKVWADVEPYALYWIPGTRIIGALTAGAGGANCPVSPAPPLTLVPTTCPQTPILDDHGHGTMTASRAAGTRSLAPGARLMVVEGLGGDSLRWVADAGFVDVSSNSWGSIAPLPPAAPGAVDISAAFAYAATRMLTLAASGNGPAANLGLVPGPTLVNNDGAPGVVMVGGHDNGRVTAWAGGPPHVVADAYAGWAAISTSSTEVKPDPIACCTSASAPYAAGGGAALVIEARRLLGDRLTGVRDGVVAKGGAGVVAKGPIADGVLTLDELRTLLLRTAEARPAEGRDDGLVHWSGEPRAPELQPFGPGANPFCQGCETLPVEWTTVPEGADLYPLVGYGAVNERSIALAVNVLRGITAMPERPEADQAYEADQEFRRAYFTGTEEP